MILFEARKVTKQYANHKALDQLSIAVPKGSIFGLLGPNGAGKTTLIRIINQITAPDQGELLFKGRKLVPKDIENIGYLPEERGLYRKMKVGDQALYLAQLKGLSKAEATTKLKSWFEKFEITDWWDRKVEELSKGMQQKVQFIVTILHEPELLIFDEPFSGFDPINVNLLKEEILKLREKGATIIFSTHNMASVEELCDHIALINQSRKILDGKVDEIKKLYKTNTYSLQIAKNSTLTSLKLPADFEVVELKEDTDSIIYTIKVPHDERSDEILQSVASMKNIISFREMIPSMNDIFIRKVNETLKTNE